MRALWPNGKTTPGNVWHEYGPRKPIWTPAGWTSNFHGGIDIGPWSGVNSTWLLAPVSGEVIYAQHNPTFGNWVQIRGANADFWLCHGRHGSMQVKKGDHVTQGQRIMIMGETGKASGVHLHYEVHVNGSRVDPRAYYASPAALDGSTNAKPAPVPTPEEEDEEDEMAMKGATIKLNSGAVQYILFNEVSGFYTEHSGVDGAYNNSIARNWDTGSWPQITEAHARVLRRSLDAVRRTELTGSVSADLSGEIKNITKGDEA